MASKKTGKRKFLNVLGNDDESLAVERLDFKLTITLIFLCCFGLLMLYSASSYECSISEEYNYDSAYMLKRQAMIMVIGVMALIVIRVLNYHIFTGRFAIVVYIFGLCSLWLTITPLGVSSNGATRWVNLGFIQFQIAELVKITTIIFLAYLVQRFYRARGSIKMTLYMWIAGGFPAVLVYVLTNDLSSAIVILGITFLTSFICMRTWKMHVIVLAAVILVVGVYIYGIATDLPTAEELDNESFRVGRIAAFLDPERYADDEGYQVLQSLYAVASGGLFGKGLGNSTQKLGAIPEAQNDMIFSVICEELGLFGAVIFLGLFAYLCFNIVKVAHASRDAGGSVLAMGVFLHLAIQTIVNVAVNLNLMPNTGIGLPFVSYGGSAILCQMIEMGLVYSVERNNRLYAMARMRHKAEMRKYGRTITEN